MAVALTDIKILHSTTAGVQGHSQAQTDPTLCLGKYASTSEVVDNTLNNLFPDFTGAENAASEEKYGCLFLWNSHATDTAPNGKLYRYSETADRLVFSMGLDPVGVVAVDSVSAQAATIANQDSAPAGVTFSAPTTYAGGITVPDIPAGSCIGVWIKCAAANTAAQADDTAVIRFAFDG